MPQRSVKDGPSLSRWWVWEEELDMVDVCVYANILLLSMKYL